PRIADASLGLTYLTIILPQFMSLLYRFLSFYATDEGLEEALDMKTAIGEQGTRNECKNLLMYLRKVI
ncbi:MAG: hypothetical protein AB4062_18620, partial [Crocosphaera sp.]